MAYDQTPVVMTLSDNDIQVNGSSSFLEFGRFVLSKDPDPGGVSLSSGKMDPPRSFAISDSRLEFSDIAGNPVQVDY